MTKGRQIGMHLIRIAALDLQYSRIGETARPIDGFLRVHAEIDDVRDKPRMPVGLIGAAHHAERHNHLATLPQHGWNDRVHRPLAAAQLVRMARLQRE